ncbi:glycosyltransferase [Fusobacterium sp. SYSU M8D902]|uniref:glycosyltransferase n=1 Tax=Fusobacterium sp. SYSU M8D902 TaxID=3159562 RepID=UPI0032E4D13F
MKVVHILNTGFYSGAENVAISIIENIDKEIESIYISLKGPIERVLQEKKIKYYLVDKLTPLSIKNILDREKPDLIHAHDFTASIISFTVANKIPIISHLHNNPPWIKKINIKSIIYGITCMKYKKILTVSSSVMKEYIFGKIFTKKTIIVGNPINIYRIKQRAKEAECSEIFDIIYLGRFTKQKDPEKFLEIIKEIVKKIPKIRVGMIGTGEMYNFIENEIKNMELQNNIRCMGFIENPYKILENTQLLCIPSKWEGFGLVAIEALALGKPVVASNVGGLPKIINNEVGKICRTTKEYIEEIYKLLTDKNYYKLKNYNAKKRAELLHNEHSYLLKLKEIYKSLIKD